MSEPAGPGGAAARATRDRALATSAGATLVARVATALGSLVSIALAARDLTAPELGVLTVLVALVVYFGFGDFGLGSLLMTELPVAHAREDFPEMRRLVSGMLSAMLLVFAVVAVGGTASIFVVPWREVLGARSVGAAQVTASLVAFVWIGAGGIVATVGPRVLTALQRAAMVRTATTISAVVSTLAVLLCSLTHASLWVYVVAFTAPGVLAGLAQLVYVWRAYPYLAMDRASLQLRDGARLLRSGVQYAILSFGWVIAYTLDAVVVSAVLGAAKAAVFAVAARLYSLVAGTLTVAGQQMWPAIAEALARGDVDWVRRRFRHSVVVVGAIAAGSSLVLILLGRAFAHVWVGENLVPPLELFVALGVWTVYLTMMTQTSYLLFACGRIRLLAILGLPIAAVNLAASIVCTHWLGLVGPIVGNLLAAALIQFVPTVLLSRRLLRELGVTPTGVDASTHGPDL